VLAVALFSPISQVNHAGVLPGAQAQEEEGLTTAPPKPPVHFKTAVTYGSGVDYATSVAIGDVNGDGHPDLVVSSYCMSLSNCDVSSLGAVSVLLNNGNDTFQAPVSYTSGGHQANSVAIVDTNGDGHPDLVVANLCQNGGFDCSNGQVPGGVSVLLGNGDGTFQAATSYNSGGVYASSIATGDLNGDGHPDLVVANRCQVTSNCDNGSVSVLLGNGDGTFRAPSSRSLAGRITWMGAVGDVNSDGHADLLAANLCQSSSNCDNGSVSVLMGNSDGTFKAPVNYGSAGYEAYSGRLRGCKWRWSSGSGGGKHWQLQRFMLRPALWRRSAGAPEQRRRHIPIAHWL
jgi:hypothetical protein